MARSFYITGQNDSEVAIQARWGRGEAPVIMHMWFADGAHWAYHPCLGTKLRDVMVALDEPLTRWQISDFVYRFGNGFLVGERIADHACKDPRAVNRNPFIVRAAFLPNEPSAKQARWVREQLREIMPEIHGGRESLEIRFR